ncbi:MAG: CPBP family intramembrane metalloprotease [Deltaproteobacteria bacterium]|nr:CPBP family intramembrane metalloprotease [Deltaproteobacteria bacterium]
MEHNRDFPNFWHALLVLAILLGIQIIGAALIYEMGLTFLRGDPKYSGLIMIFSYGFIISLLMSYKNISYRETFSPIPPPGPELSFITKLLIPVVMATIAIRILVFYVDIFVFIAFPMKQEELDMFSLFMNGGFASFVTACIIAPFVEEILFRGFFLRSFLHNYSRTNALLISSLLFAVYHFNIHQFPIAIFLGLFSGWLYLITASLWPSIMAHISINSISVLFYNFSRSQSDLSETLFAAPALPFAFALLLLFTSLHLIKKAVN